MKQFLSLLILLFTIIGIAQSNSINYKALIKDGGGNVVANQSIDIQFIIYEGAGETTNVYQETHTVNTDANGIAIVNIGEGTTSDVFADINWGADNHYLNVQINTGGGLTNMGTTGFNTVPYALNAANVTGLEQITENGKTGWRLIGRNPDNFGNIGVNAIDLSKDNGPSTTRGATGAHAFASGIETTASGNRSTAMGQETTASGFASTAMGYRSEASGDESVAMGGQTTASNDYSTAMGYLTTASGLSSTAMGEASEASNDYSTAMGYYTIASNENSTAMGHRTTASGVSSTAMGYRTTASGNESTAMGNFTTASGISSTAMGRNTTASGSQSTAMGESTTASGIRSLATGNGTIASGNNAFTVGNNTKAEAQNSVAMGRYNVGGGTPGSWVETDPLFEIGNGIDDANRSNALTVLKNGTVTADSFDISEIDTAGDKALITKEYADANYTDTGVAPTGLKKITEDDNIGWRLIGRNPDNFGDIGFGAIDLSKDNGLSTTRGATGTYAFASGVSTTASAFHSTAMGTNTTASGGSSTAMGTGTTASNPWSTAMGYSTNAFGDAATSMGYQTKAEARASTAIGLYNVGGGTAGSIVQTDPLFEVGNGTADNSRSNALTILKNGTITAPTFSTAEIDTAGDKALITKEYAEANFNPTGLEKITENGSSGWRLIGRTAANFENIGDNAVDFSTGSGASTPGGASGVYAFAAGRTTTASGTASTALGLDTTASGVRTLAAGNGTTASGNNAFSVGWDTKAEANNSVAMGRYNVGGGNAGSWVATDPVFEIGNGADDASRTNAFTVLKNGNATLAGTLTENSDRRLKTEVAQLNYGLNEILQLNPVSYYWKKDRDTQDQKSIGLIAQEVQPLLKELVRTAQDKDQTLSVNYSGLIPVLIKALQEQQEQIETLKKDNQLKEDKNKTLEARLEKVEQLINQMSN